MTPNKPRGKHAPANMPDADPEEKAIETENGSRAEAIDNDAPTQVLPLAQADGADDLATTQVLPPVQSDETDDPAATQVLPHMDTDENDDDGAEQINGEGAPEGTVDTAEDKADNSSAEADEAAENENAQAEADDEAESDDAESGTDAESESAEETADVTGDESKSDDAEPSNDEVGTSGNEPTSDNEAPDTEKDAEPVDNSNGKRAGKHKGKHTKQAIAAAAAAAASSKAAASTTPKIDDAAKTALITPAKNAHTNEPAEDLADEEQLQAQVQADREAAFVALGSPDGPHGQGSVPAPAPMISQEESNFIATAIEQARAEKRRAHLKVAGITIGVLIGLVAIAYAAGIFVFSGRFLPHTTIGEYDVSMKTDDEVVALIDKTMEDYQLDVSGDGFSYKANGKDLNLSADSKNIVKTMHSDQESWKWPVLIFETSHDETDLLQVKFSPKAYKEDVKAAVEAFNEEATPPTNATIVYNQVSGKFDIQPEEIGTQLDAQTILEDIADAISELNGKVVLDEDNLLKPSVVSTDEKIIEAAELASGMVSAKLSLNMGGMSIATVDGTSLSPFVSMNDDFEIVFEDEALNSWVNDLAYGFDTIGTERYYTRADGKEIVVPAGGVYGWEVDSEALKAAIIDGIRAGQVADIEVPCVQDAYVYNGPNQRDWGPRYVDVDLSEQYVRFYDTDGSIIWESACISGSPDGVHNTGPGVWYVNNKESPSKLIGYENGKKIYETMVTYWMAFEYNGIGFHDATWQPGFGGSLFAEGYGSHGCVNLPYDAAQSLFGIIEIGDPVVVHF